MVIKIIKDLIELALHGEKFAEISAEEVERVSMREQMEHEGTA